MAASPFPPGSNEGAAGRVGEEVARLLGEAVADAERIRADAARREAERRARQGRLFERQGELIADSARAMQAGSLRAVESLAAAAERLVDASHRSAPVRPSWPEPSQEPVEILLAETREIRMRFRPGPGV